MRYDYDMLGNRIHQASMEAGERWMLNDVAGKPLRAWDSRGHRLRTAYDALRRPTAIYLHEGSGTGAAGRTRPCTARASRTPRRATCAASPIKPSTARASSPRDAYDFKGNLLRSSRQLAHRLQDRLWTGR